MNPMEFISVWFKRATGIGYEEYPPLTVYKRNAEEMKVKTDDLVVQVEQLERDLRRRGHLR